MRKTLLILVIIATMGASLFSCSGRKVRSMNSESSTQKIMDVMNAATKIGFEIDNIDSVKLLFAEEENDERVMLEADYADFANFLSTADYDTEWNDSGVMVKMATPDYTAIISYKNKPADDSDWLMVWKENGRVKFSGKWFFIAEDKREGLYTLLERYNKEDGVVEMTVFPERNGGAPQTLELTVKNNTTEVIQFGARYSIERLVDGKWAEVDLGNLAVIAIMYGLQPGDSHTYTINLFTDTIAYPEGDYRVVKLINIGMAQARPFYADFRIIEPR